MNLARPVGSVPTGPITIDRRISRAGIFASAGVLAAINAQAGQILDTLRYLGPVDALTGLAGISVVIWAAMIAALKIGLEDKATSFRSWDPLVLGIAVLLSFIPISYAAGGALLLSSIYLFATSRPGEPPRRTAMVLLALTGPLVFGRIFLHVFEAPILAIDAHLVGAIIGTPVDGNTVGFVDQNTKFLVGAGCSSVHNMSLAIVLWTTAAALFRLRIDRGYAKIGAAMVAWMFGLNIARLAAIGIFPNDFEFLHTGTGAVLFGWAGLVGAGLLAGLGVIRAADRQQ